MDNLWLIATFFSFSNRWFYILRLVFAGIYNILYNIGGKLLFSFFVAIIRHIDVLWREHNYGLALSAGKEMVDRVLR